MIVCPMPEMFASVIARAMGLTPIAFNEIVHRGYFPAPETARGVGRKVDPNNVIGIYVLAELMRSGLKKSLAGSIATAVMQALGEHESKGLPDPVVLRAEIENGTVRITPIMDAAQIASGLGGDGSGILINFDLGAMWNRIGERVKVFQTDFEHKQAQPTGT